MKKNISPSITIVISCYGVENYLNRCVSSIVGQTLKNIEIILVDDGSKDHVPEMCEIWAKKDTRIKVIHKQNAGLGYARNSGLDVAEGEYIAFIDGDDYVSKDMMQSLYSTAMKFSAQAVYCGINTVDRHGNIIDTRIETTEVLHVHGTDACKEIGLEMIGSPSKREVCKYSMSVWHSIYKTDFLRKHSIRFCSEREFISEDMIFDVDFFGHANNVIFLPEAHYYYCYNQASLSRTFNTNRYKRTVIHYQELKRRLKENSYPEQAIDCANKYMIWATRNIINNALSSNLRLIEKYRIVSECCNDRKTWELIKASTVTRFLHRLPYVYYYGLTRNLPIILIILSLCANFKNKLINR
jgi:glycosyltransferase involved in cell wall biosynthesis